MGTPFEATSPNSVWDVEDPFKATTPSSTWGSGKSRLKSLATRKTRLKLLLEVGLESGEDLFKETNLARLGGSLKSRFKSNST